MNAPTPEATTTTRTEQADYQVRLDWGLEGLTRLAPADLVVAVDVLGAATRAVVSLDQPSAGDATTIRSLAEDARDAASSMDDVVAEAEAGGAQVVLGACATPPRWRAGASRNRCGAAAAPASR